METCARRRRPNPNPNPKPDPDPVLRPRGVRRARAADPSRAGVRAPERRRVAVGARARALTPALIPSLSPRACTLSRTRRAAGAQDVKTIDVGFEHVCAVTASGKVACAGHNGIPGRLGTGYHSSVYGEPELVPLSSNVRVMDVACGRHHTCVLTDGAAVVCWGGNNYGQLGVGDTMDRDTPEELQSLKTVPLGGPAHQVSAGKNFNCAIVSLLDEPSTKRVVCWGANTFGQLGLGDELHRGNEEGEMGSDNLPYVPYEVYVPTYATHPFPPLGEPRTIDLGRHHACVLTTDDDLKCAHSRAPSGGRPCSASAAGWSGARSRLARAPRARAERRCWGANYHGELGLGDRAHRGNSPGELHEYRVVHVGLLHKAYAISAGEQHTCALTYEWVGRPTPAEVPDGPCVKCWGGARTRVAPRDRTRCCACVPRPPPRRARRVSVACACLAERSPPPLRCVVVRAPAHGRMRVRALAHARIPRASAARVRPRARAPRQPWCGRQL